MQPIALIPDGIPVDAAEMSGVAAAIQIQLQRDFVAWGIPAICSWYARVEDLPSSCWPVFVRARANGSAGFHEARDGLPPFAVVAHTPDGSWSTSASHEVMEMLVDPRGDRFARGPDPMDPLGQVDVLMEICDPCQGAIFSYQVDHHHWATVSDFCLPSYYRQGTAGPPYSFRRNVTSPFSVAMGGLLSYRLPDGKWKQLQESRVVSISPADALSNRSVSSRNFRGCIDRAGGRYKGPPTECADDRGKSRYAVIRELAKEAQIAVVAGLKQRLVALDAEFAPRTHRGGRGAGRNALP